MKFLKLPCSYDGELQMGDRSKYIRKNLDLQQGRRRA